MTERQKVLLIGADTGEDEEFETSMKELSGLAEACMMQVAGIITQKLETVNKALYIGSGKVAEARAFAQDVGAEAAVFDNALSPSQMRNLQKELDMPVMDRTSLILDIFSRRARTREAKLQVETARLQYMLPRLVGMHDSLGRQGGTSGNLSNKGAGEKKLELDRRKIEHRIAELKKELEEVSTEKEIQRKKRVRSNVPRVCLVGYTNAGKSTLMNGMVEAYIGDESKKVFEEDMLFATLETYVRLISRGDNRDFFLSDTVGFIHKLPHGLIKAFRSTLDEVREADLLLHVVDFSDENYKRHIKVTEETLREMGAGDIPVIYVYNKVDLCGPKIPAVSDNRIYMSAKSGDGIAELAERITQILYAENSTEQYLIPYDKGNILSYLLENGGVISREYLENGVRLVVNCRQSDHERCKAYRVSS
ncbi:MAG: GTPase HflX [Lachnospiraceae bacterium]|nr:GTPase HflX [Lachnospiraceae bacterium]